MAGIENGEIRTALSVGEVAERSGVAVSAIHFYEKKGLIGLRDQLTSCIGCGCLSIGACRLRNPRDELGNEGPGARLLDKDE